MSPSNQAYLCPDCTRELAEATITQANINAGTEDVYGITRTVLTTTRTFCCPEGHGTWISVKSS